jgi:hypothetical protein
VLSSTTVGISTLCLRAASQIEAFDDVPDQVKRVLIGENRAFYKAEFDRCEREIRALVARGMRLPHETVH